MGSWGNSEERGLKGVLVTALRKSWKITNWMETVMAPVFGFHWEIRLAASHRASSQFLGSWSKDKETQGKVLLY